VATVMTDMTSDKKSTGRKGKDATELTTLKAHKPLAAIVGKLATLKGMNIPDVLDLYAKQMEDDLLREFARQQKDIEQARRG
jgi:hypothetical protein